MQDIYNFPAEIAPIEAPFAMAQLRKPEFPAHTFDIRDFGAVEGGKIKNTEVFKKAIFAATQAGGGTVLVPRGKWLTGPIHLENQINLHLTEGAEVLFSQDFADYLPAVYCRHEGINCYKYSPFIYANGKTNIAITGRGVLNGQGKPWWDLTTQEKAPGELLRAMADQDVPVEERIFIDDQNGRLRPAFIQPIVCRDILIEGVTILYGAFWTITPTYCENIIVRGVKIMTEGEYGHTPNGDGINPSSCKNVLIEYCYFDTGDDCIAIKSGRDKDGIKTGRPSENMVIRYCRGDRGHGGIVIGSEMSGGVRNVYAHDCVFQGTDRALRIKAARERGGYVKDLWFRNITADRIVHEAIMISMKYTADGFSGFRKGDQPPWFGNYHFYNITCHQAAGNLIKIDGLEEQPVENLHFEKINLTGEQGIAIANAKNVTFKDLTIWTQQTPAVNIDPGEAIKFEGEVKFTTD